MGTVEIDLRCPYGPRKLLSRIIHDGDRPTIVDGNLIEMNCIGCRDHMRRNGDPDVLRVLHRFNLLGELVETVTYP